MKGSGVRWATIGIWLIALGFSGCLSWCSPCSCATTCACGSALCGPSSCSGGGGCAGGCAATGSCSSSAGCNTPTRLDAATPDATTCVAQCTGRQCGLDPVCSTPCGTCDPTRTCNERGVCEASPPPSARPVAPLSAARIASHRPRFRVALRDGATHTRIQVCRDRACATVIETIESTSPAAATIPLEPGAYFWRAFAMRDGVASTQASATWEFFVSREDARVSSTIGAVFDCNGDGLADIAVASAGPVERAGQVDVYLGARSRAFSAPTTLRRADLADGFASSVASAGDVNGDGYIDLIVGASRAILGSDAPGVTGAAFVYHGSAGGIASTPSTTLQAFGPTQRFGRLVLGVGDIDRDGYGDVAVLSDAMVTVYVGGPTGVQGSGYATFAAPVTAESIASIAAVADTDFDDRSDTLVTNVARADNARAQWLDGDTGWSNPVTSAPVVFATQARVLSSSAAGDVDGDGLADLLVGDPDEALALDPRGRVALFRGSAPANFAAPAAILRGSSQNGRFGFAMASAGDVDDDGFDDVLIGAPRAEQPRPSIDAGLADAATDPSDSAATICFGGSVSLHRGSWSGLEQAPRWIHWGSATSCDGVGATVSFVGDVDGDRVGDLAVSAPTATVAGRTQAGRVSIFFGGRAIATEPGLVLEGSSIDQRFGWAIAGGY